MALKVGVNELRAAAQNLESLRDQATGTLQNYLNASHDVMAPGAWQGAAAAANINAAEEIHNAQTKLTTQWGELIQTLRAAADRYEQQEESSQSTIASVSQSM
ncbi:WXG100 family type VII secretion target [Mycobacterium sp. MYCO198283]|uniref:WXG100 family type VII secretion target n=1 Tax=Mycobacterium sp. MYCO198283 TaxID=2883505 RepID=UPI001E628C17|nr:WXG100 family type VII secretion target [Mycobacterium sp. MYCO198283]MCG5433046.1 WXG100 family type VII secretion target [Mycobacterium sp. MYCO198283]